MGSELPHIPGGSDVVLYPASVKASTDLQDSLAAAGFKVSRINTYNTVSGTAPVFFLQSQGCGHSCLQMLSQSLAAPAPQNTTTAAGSK